MLRHAVIFLLLCQVAASAQEEQSDCSEDERGCKDSLESTDASVLIQRHLKLSSAQDEPASFYAESPEPKAGKASAKKGAKKGPAAGDPSKGAGKKGKGVPKGGEKAGVAPGKSMMKGEKLSGTTTKGDFANRGGKGARAVDTGSARARSVPEAASMSAKAAIALGTVVTLFLLSFCCLCWVGSGQGLKLTWDSHVEDKEVHVHQPYSLHEDTYGLAVSILVRDASVVASGHGQNILRQLRFSLVFMLVFVNMGVQLFLMFKVMDLVTPPIVKQSRHYYDQFEWHMYGQNATHVRNLSDGTRRGLAQFFQPELFATLDANVKNQVCHIPLSQPAFFIMVLFVWSLTCVGDLRKCLGMFHSLVMEMPRVSDLTEVTRPLNPDEPSSTDKLIVGLTYQMKVFITTIILIPRLLLTSVLLWLGSRWLVATNDFSEILLNTVALEFVLLLQDLLFLAIVPERNKQDCRSIKINPPETHEAAGCFVYASSFVWGLVALAWAMLYTYYFQQVLPEYQWDVRDICSAYLKPA